MTILIRASPQPPARPPETRPRLSTATVSLIHPSVNPELIVNGCSKGGDGGGQRGVSMHAPQTTPQETATI